MEENTTVVTTQDDAAMEPTETTQTEAQTVEEPRSDDGSTQTAKAGEEQRFSTALNERMRAFEQKRAREMKRELEQQYAGELTLARNLARLNNGKDYKTIEKDIFDGTVRHYAEENAIPEGIARELLTLKMQLGQTVQAAPAAQAEDDPHIQALVDQANDLQARFGVDMNAGLRDNPEALARVASGEWDMNRAYLELYAASRAAQLPGQSTQETEPQTARPRATAPAVVRQSAATPATKSVKNMSAEEFRALEERVEREGTVTI